MNYASISVIKKDRTVWTWGRYNFYEGEEYAEELNLNCNILDYLVWGGFPKRFEFKDQGDQIKYLLEIKRSIVEKDLIIRFNIEHITGKQAKELL